MAFSFQLNLLVSAIVSAALLPGCASPSTGTTAATRNLSGKTDIPMLVPSGKTEKWPLCTLVFDDVEKPSYTVWRENPTRLETHYNFGVKASAKRPQLPKTYQPDPYSGVEKPIDLSQEIFIPAIGRKVHYYCKSASGGSENAIFATEPITWPDGHGGTVYYVIETESDEPEKILDQVKWDKPGSMANAKAAKN
ncbi:MAG: hypothetical protein ABI600_06110 [Luteolibacter sp.]